MRKTMNLDNRRLKEIQQEKLHWKDQLKNAETMSECLAFGEKIDLLEEEEKQILKRNGVDIQ